MKKAKQVVGKCEVINFPDLGLYDISAKIDTGAYTSALHCHDIFEKDGVLHFKLLDPTHPEYNEQDQKSTDFYKKEIKNSFGESEERYVIKTRIGIGNRTFKSLISLTNRGTMRYPVLLGRKLLKRRFIVDVEFEYLLSKK